MPVKKRSAPTSMKAQVRLKEQFRGLSARELRTRMAGLTDRTLTNVLKGIGQGRGRDTSSNFPSGSKGRFPRGAVVAAARDERDHRSTQKTQTRSKSKQQHK